MATIEERAKQYINIRQHEGNLKSSYAEAYDAYVQGATDEREIAEKDKAEALAKLLDNADKWFIVNLPIIWARHREDFRKAMEG